jgi:hypothetical protein
LAAIKEFFMPEADPAERVVDRREPGPHPAAPLKIALELGEREVGRRLDQPAQVGLVRLEHGPAGARRSAPVRRCRSPAPAA